MSPYTPYGFTWGPATVERIGAFERGGDTWRVLRIATAAPSQELEIYVSPRGRRLRVFRRGVELKPTQTATEQATEEVR